MASGRARRLRWIALLLGLPLLLAVAVLWLFATEAGTRAAIAGAQALLGPRLEVVDARGRLAGPLRIERFAWKDVNRRIVAHQVDLDWSPRGLLQGEVDVDRLIIGQLDVATRSQPSGPPPTDLTLPLGLRLQHTAITRIEIGALDGDTVKPRLTIEGLTAKAASDGVRHHVDSLRFITARLSVAVQGSVVGQQPFPVRAGARIAGEEDGHPFTVTVTARGALRALALEAVSQSGTLDVDAWAQLDAFAPRPLKRVEATASGFDPAAWLAGAPHARLRLEAHISPVEGVPDAIAGEVRAENAIPGRIDEQRMPVRRIESKIYWQSERLQLPQFVAQLTAGRIGGSAEWAGGQWSVDARAADVDASTWHRALRPTRLAGPVIASGGTVEQRVQAELVDPRFRIQVDARRTPDAVNIETARISGKGAALEVSGHIDPKGAFDLDGRLRNFNPALFADVPRARLNADLSAQGRMAEQLALLLHFELGDSQVAGHAVGGRGDVTVARDRVEHAQVHLTAGANRLEASGALGERDDTLTLNVNAPRLDQIGFAGALQGQVVLSGALRSPAARWNIDAPRLALPNGFNLRGLATEGSMEAGMANIKAVFNLASVGSGAEPLASAVSARLEGERTAHTLSVSGTLREQHRIDAAARGGLDTANVWKGTLERLEWHGPQSARLTAPAPLRVSSGDVLIENAAFQGSAGNGVIERLAWQPGRVQTRGRFTGLSTAAFVTDERMATSLTLGGEWDMDLSDRATGRAIIRRESGDVVLKADQPLALGIERLLVTLDVANRSAQVRVDGAGTRAGVVRGNLGFELVNVDGAWSVARNAPWRGEMSLDVPSIAWINPVLGENVTVNGRVAGVVRVAGTPAQPVTDGELTGSGLLVRLRDQGLELGGGTMRVELTPDVVRLRRLDFVSVASQPPRNQRIAYQRLTAQPGRLSAEGEIAVKTGAGRIALHAERVALSQLPNRWLMASGNGGITFDERRLSVKGDVKLDAAYVELEPPGMPRLSDDVVVVGRTKKEGRALPRVELDVQVDLGNSFYFFGNGLDTRLAGQVHLTAPPGGALRATGFVRTVGGTFDAYGRELSIERGIVNFQGLIDNPGLNVRALRKNLQVEAGVEVTGTAKRPVVHLISEPDVPEQEKLSWLIFGRPPDQSLSARDADLLLSAATALRGQQSGGGALRQITQGLGLEELGVSSGNLSGVDRGATSRVASAGGFGGSSATTVEQIATVGKRIGDNAVLSYERSLATAESIVKLTVGLSRRLSLVGRVGADNAVDLFYTFTFGR